MEELISRQAVLDLMQLKMGGKELYKAVYDMPPVTPTRKSGLRWIERFNNEDKWLECPHCHKDSDNAYAYCPNCGASFKEEKRNNKPKTYIDCQKCENFRNPDYSKCIRCEKAR